MIVFCITFYFLLEFGRPTSWPGYPLVSFLCPVFLPNRRFGGGQRKGYRYYPCRSLNFQSASRFSTRHTIIAHRQMSRSTNRYLVVGVSPTHNQNFISYLSVFSNRSIACNSPCPLYLY